VHQPAHRRIKAFSGHSKHRPLRGRPLLFYKRVPQKPLGIFVERLAELAVLDEKAQPLNMQALLNGNLRGLLDDLVDALIAQLQALDPAN